MLFSCKSVHQDREKIIGVKIYEYNGNFNDLFAKWEGIGINTVFAGTELLSDNNFKKLADRFNIGTFAILPIFYAQEELEKDSSLFAITQFGTIAEKEWVKFVCPSQKQFIINKIKYISMFVKEHNPTGISLDFIRHFSYWEKIYSNTNIDSLPNTCFNESCIIEFCYSNNILYPNNYKSANEKYKWIRNNYFEKWIEWKCNLISETVKSIVTEVKMINPHIKINLHAVPWRQDDFGGAIISVIGQDLKELAKYVDYISPMTYSHMLKRKPKWIHSVVEDAANVSDAKILPSIQVGNSYLNDNFSVDEFAKCIDEAMAEPSCGIIYWNWKMLISDKIKYNTVKNKKY